MVAEAKDVIYLDYADYKKATGLLLRTYSVEYKTHVNGLILQAIDRAAGSIFYAATKINNHPNWIPEDKWLESPFSAIRIIGSSLQEPDFSLEELELAESIINGG